MFTGLWPQDTLGSWFQFMDSFLSLSGSSPTPQQRALHSLTGALCSGVGGKLQEAFVISRIDLLFEG